MSAENHSLQLMGVVGAGLDEGASVALAVRNVFNLEPKFIDSGNVQE